MLLFSSLILQAYTVTMLHLVICINCEHLLHVGE